MALGLTAFLLIYLLGGITFLPLLVATVFLHAYCTLPRRPDVDPGRKTSDGARNKNGVGDSSSSSSGGGGGGDSSADIGARGSANSSANSTTTTTTSPDDDIVQPGDSVGALAAERASRGKDEASRARAGHAVHADRDVAAAGYFAVCREYTPMGINAKPIERATPVGSATVAAPSPSVYQTMYRTIFDRKPVSGPLDGRASVSQRPKKAGNVFYVVLRYAGRHSFLASFLSSFLPSLIPSFFPLHSLCSTLVPARLFRYLPSARARRC